VRTRRHTLWLWAGLALLAHTPGTRAQARSLAIHEIQGTGARSPHEGAVVITTGVVTGRKSNGFFIQSADGAGDGRDASSDGLFVFTSSAPPAAASPGTFVAVTGRVIEFVPNADPDSPPLTELTEVAAIDVRGAGMTLPAPVDVRSADRVFPPSGADPLERLEGMRVRVASLTTVSGTLGSVNETNATGAGNGVFYGVTTGVARPFRQPGIGMDESLPPGTPCCVPRHLSNPERLRVDSDGQPGAAAVNVPSGSVVRNLVGPLDFAFRAYTVLPDPGSPPQVTAAPAFDPVRRPTEDEVAVASFNLQRFFDTTDDPSVGDAVLTAAAYQNRLRKASLYIRRLLHLPHVIGVQEVENLATLRALADTLNREAREARELKPRYEAYLEEGNDPGGIDVGLLVDRARVEVLQVVQEGRGEQYRTPAGQLELLHDRPPLALRARVTWPIGVDRPLSVLVAHMRSLIDIDHPVNGPRVRLKRALQAESLATMIDRRLSIDAPDALLVVGDMNAFEFSDGFVDVVGTIRGGPAPRDTVVQPTRDLVSPDLINLVEVVPAQDRYSYVFDGVAQTLDHMLVSPALWPFVTAFGHARGNADAPETWRSDATRPERISDHDPALVYLRFPRN
jgi:uncharacterized protein